MEEVLCSCKEEMVLLSGTLKNGRMDDGKVYVCSTCDVPEKAVGNEKSIIQISKENHEHKSD